VIGRVLELIFAAIVVGILDRCQYYLDAAHVDSNSRRLHSSHGRYQHMCRDHLDAPTQILFLGLSSRLRPLRILDGFVWAFRKCKLYNSLPLPRESAWILSDVLTWNDSSPEPVAATHTGIGIIGGYYWGRYYYTPPINTATYSLVGTAYCSEWRSVLAFGFITGWLFLANACVVSF
jgi:hypothetical protein